MEKSKREVMFMNLKLTVEEMSSESNENKKRR
jgi:hypothetical protein